MRRAKNVKCLHYLLKFQLFQTKYFYDDVSLFFKFNESRYKQGGVTPHFSTGENPLKKYQEKTNIGKYWQKNND